MENPPLFTMHRRSGRGPQVPMEDSPWAGRGGGREWVGARSPGSCGGLPTVRAGSWEGVVEGRGLQKWEIQPPPPPVRPGGSRGQLGRLLPILGPHHCRKDPGLAAAQR